MKIDHNFKSTDIFTTIFGPLAFRVFCLFRLNVVGVNGVPVVAALVADSDGSFSRRKRRQEGFFPGLALGPNFGENLYIKKKRCHKCHDMLLMHTNLYFLNFYNNFDLMKVALAPRPGNTN